MVKAILLSDSRDTLFQSSVWGEASVENAVRVGAVIFSLEGNPGANGAPRDILVRDQRHNYLWLRKCFPSAFQNKKWLDVLPVSCAGVTVGGARGVMQYVQSMITVALTVSDKCFRTNIDQGIHNVLLNASIRGEDGSLHIWPISNGESPVYNAGYGMPLSYQKRPPLIYVKRGAWTFHPAIVHQFDRDQHVKKMMEGL